MPGLASRRRSLTRPNFSRSANVFAELNLYSAIIWSGLDQQELGKRRESTEDGYRIDEETAGGYLEPYTAVAVGMGHDRVDPYSVLVFVHADQEAAAANAVTLRRKLDTGTRLSNGQPWSDYISRSEIVADGTLVYARIWTSTPLLMLDAYYDFESIFLTH